MDGVEDWKNAVTDLRKLVSDQQAMIAAQTKQLNTMMKLNSNISLVETDTTAELIDTLSKRIELFKFDAAGGRTFQVWWDKFSDTFMEDAKALDDKAKTRLLLLRLDAYEHGQLCDSILPAKPKDKTFEDIVKELTKLFRKPDSLFCRRWKCLQVTKKDTESYTAYATSVNKLCEEFDFKSMTADEFKCLIFLLGLRTPKSVDIRARLHNKLDITDDVTTLSKLSDEAERLVNLKHDTQLGTLVGPAPVMKIQHQNHSRRSFKKPAAAHTTGNVKSSDSPKYPCWRCGAMHFIKDCSFATHACSRCKIVGHKEGYCSVAARIKSAGASPKTNVVKFLEQTAVDNNNIPVGLGSAVDLQNNNNGQQSFVYASTHFSGERKFIEVKINGFATTLQMDTGADVTILTVQVWEAMGRPPLEPAPRPPVDANEKKITCFGVLPAVCELEDMTRTSECFVTSLNTNLFGNNWMTLFGLWDRPPTSYCLQVREPSFNVEVAVDKLKEDFQDVFSPTLGRCVMTSVQLHLKPGSAPVFRPKRQVPFRVLDQVGEELERLQMAGIISPIDHSDFAAPVVVVLKATGCLRLCGDYSTGLNNALLSHEYPIPTPDSIFSNLAHSRVFSQIDLKDAYLQIPVDEEASRMLTINTHRGLFAFNRLCPGVKPAAGIFQQMMDKIFADLDFVKTYFDDIMVHTPDMRKHVEVLQEVFTRLRKFNIRARWEKCHFFQSEIKFLGIIVDAVGLRPNPEKIEAITSMPAPENQGELHSFLGAIGFYMKFVKSMSSLRAPLDKLMKRDAPFEWNSDCQRAFEKFKEILLSDLLLIHYDPDLPITIASDASCYGIGAVAYHTLPDGSIRAFYHTSRRLTPAERNYSQIEKEGLGIIHAMTKFHKYIWGRTFTLLTDHRPLLTIFSPTKGIPQHTANRLQRWALTLMAYDYEIQFIRTEDFGHADVLSRLIADRPPEDFVVAFIQEEEIICSKFIESCEEIPVKFAEIGRATGLDADLVLVRDYVQNGWPSSPKLIQSEEARSYFNLKDSLTLINDVLIFRDRTVVPRALRTRVLKHLHATHPGMTRMKALARGYVFWPGIDKQIEELVSQCQPCGETAKAPVKMKLASWPVPNGPWERVHIDYMGPFHEKMYLVLVDAFSKWPEVFRMSSATTSVTVERIFECCSRFGSMITLVSDNGPQFTSAEFEEFCSVNNITHLTSPPYHPQSNGQAESFVGHLKRTLAKRESASLAYMMQFLQTYRATRGPHTPTGESPAELMMGRSMRLPLAAVLPPPPVPSRRNTEMEEQYNHQHGAIERFFEEGEEVSVRLAPSSKWVPAVVIEKVGSVVYNILAGNLLLRAHTNQLRAAHWQLPLDDDSRGALPAPRRNPRAVTRSSPPVLRPRTGRK